MRSRTAWPSLDRYRSEAYGSLQNELSDGFGAVAARVVKGSSAFRTTPPRRPKDCRPRLAATAASRGAARPVGRNDHGGSRGFPLPAYRQGSGTSTIPVTAAVVREKGGPFTFEDLTLGTDLRPDEVLVKVVAAGLCQTDIHVRDQALPTPLPAVLGHEGAGIVERVGDAVSTVAPGDQVVMSYQACGHCTPCLSGYPAYCALSFPANFGGSRLDGTNALHAGGEEIHGHFFGQSSFATHALATERNVVKVHDEDIPLELLGPLGCGLQTGAGAVLNSLKIAAGASVVIVGAGTVGLAAVMAAKVAGASPVIAVDVVPERLDLARELGATHIVNAKEEDTAARIRGSHPVRRGLRPGDHRAARDAHPRRRRPRPAGHRRPHRRRTCRSRTPR